MAKPQVHGLDKILNNLNKEIKKIGRTTEKGLIRAGIMIVKDTEKTSPVTPVDTGNLRASRYVAVAKGGVEFGPSPTFRGDESSEMSSGHNKAISEAKGKSTRRGPTITIGFSAFYAWFVHENVGADFAKPIMIGGKPKKRREGAGAQFFESSLKNTRGKVLAIIAKEAKIR